MHGCNSKNARSLLRRLLMFKSFFLCWGVSVKLHRQRESPIKKGAQKNPIKVIFCYCCFILDSLCYLSKETIILQASLNLDICA